MQRDLVTRPYGRFYHLPRCLAERGHDITILLLDYRNQTSVDIHRDGMRWISESLSLRNPGRYPARVRQLLQVDRPDWVIGFSDTYFGIMAQYYGHRFGVRSCIDAYDNYESYLPWMVPLHALWHRALSRADLVTAAGPDLVQHMSRQRNGRPAVVVSMAADPAGFRPLDQAECRSRMGLTADGPLVGYCGSLHKSRGVEVLFEAFEQLRQACPNAQLVLSGRQWGNVPVPESVCSLGYIADEKMPLLLNCMDTLVVTNRDSVFGRYSHPVKLYEAMACQLPVVATRTPATEWILAQHLDLLVPPADPQALGLAIRRCLKQGRLRYVHVPTWDSSCDALESALLDNDQVSGGLS